VSKTDGYRDGTALWAAASARAKAVASATGADVSTLLRRFVNERFSVRASLVIGAFRMGATAAVTPLAGSSPGSSRSPHRPHTDDCNCGSHGPVAVYR
jgi:hypothetical protein